MEFCLSCMGVIYLVCGAEGEVLDLRSGEMLVGVGVGCILLTFVERERCGVGKRRVMNAWS